MRRFVLNRSRDISGISGTGIVAEGIEWTDGSATIRWFGAHPSTVNWNSISDAEFIHGHGGATIIEYIDDLDK